MSSSSGKLPQNYRPLAVWSAPRAISHAFEKMMRARNDHIIFSEPFNDAWYHGPEGGSHRRSDNPDETLTYKSIFDAIAEAAKHSRVYVRAQPWQFGKKYLTKETFAKFQSSLLIRDPAYSIPSYYKLRPDFAEQEVGYIDLHKTWLLLKEMNEPCPIVDAIDIQTNPKAYIRAWCDAVGIERNDTALTWPKGADKSWNSWVPYTEAVVQTTGFQPPSEIPKVTNERVARVIDSSRRYYREMEAEKIIVF